MMVQKYIQWTYLISAGPVLTLYLAHSHCDKKYVNLSKQAKLLAIKRKNLPVIREL
jgi:hypothetical protein